MGPPHIGKAVQRQATLPSARSVCGHLIDGALHRFHARIDIGFRDARVRGRFAVRELADFLPECLDGLQTLLNPRLEVLDARGIIGAGGACDKHYGYSHCGQNWMHHCFFSGKEILPIDEGYSGQAIAICR